MNHKYRIVLCTILKSVGVLLAIPAIAILCISLLGYGDIYETTSISDYGKITGNFDNNAPKAFIRSFFPKQIEESFSNIIYHYKSKKGDAYAYECYLEFVIEDSDAYENFVELFVDKNSCIPFSYDSSFIEQSISNVLDLQPPKIHEAVYTIETAEIGKILFSDEQQRIIFIAIGMYDGGGANTIELGHFFMRFQIEPWEYMQNAYATPYYQNLDIPNKDMP